jgi:hypothetical protein
MSSWARSWAYEQRVGERVNGKWRKNPGAKSVLAAICEFPDQDGRCWVSQATLARMTDMSERSVREHLSFLEHTAKLIRREERRRKDGTRASDYIWVLAPKHRLRPPEPEGVPEDDQPEESAGGVDQPEESASSTGKSRQNNRQISPNQPEESAGHDPSRGSVKEDPSFDSFANAQESANSSDESDSPPPAQKPKDLKQYAVEQLMNRVNAARARGAPIHDPLDSDRGQYAKFFATRSRRHDIDTLLLTLDYLVAKASGEVEGEPKAWCGFDTALDRVLFDKWRPGKAPPKPAGEKSSGEGSPPEVVEAVRNHPDLSRYASLAERFDFSSLSQGEQPPYPIFAALGIKDPERWTNCDRLGAVARRAVRERQAADAGEPDLNGETADEAAGEELPDTFEEYLESVSEDVRDLPKDYVEMLRRMYEGRRGRRLAG